MSQIQKLIDKLTRRPIPSDMTFDELKKIAKHYGCDSVNRGNHQRAIVYKPAGKVVVVPDHGKHVQQVYVKELKELFESIMNEEK